MRLPNWEQNLADVLSRALYEKFCWGVNDCASFAARCVLAITGKDVFAQYRDQYGSLRSAYKTLREIGGLEMALNHLYAPRTVQSATLGDLGLTHKKMLCVYAGPNRWVAPGAMGLSVITSDQVVLAWDIF